MEDNQNSNKVEESSILSPTQPTPITTFQQQDNSLIAALLVVGFHHAHGPIVEFSVPPLPQQQKHDDESDNSNSTQQTSLEKLKVPEEWNFLPFLALPDGAHQKDEDFAYFHLPPVPGWPVAETTLFGISCNRQIAAKDLLVKAPDVTRSIVQKAVVVLARQPIFGPLRQKLAVITSAWFNQKDFTQLDILYDFYQNLQSTYHGPIDDSTLYMGTSLRELIHKFKSKTLMLLKLLLLEKRILFYGYPVERLCTFEYSLMSLVPGLLRSLQDSGDPELDTSEKFLKITEAKELSNGKKESLLRFMGLPLRLFEKGSFFQPYLPLQQIDILSSEKTKSYVVGTTNQIFFHHKSDINNDVLVNVETGTLEFHNQRLAALVGPTMADRRWMEKIVRVVNDTWDETDPSRPIQNTYLGSDDYLRARFEEYILSLLSSMKHAQDANLIPDNNSIDESTAATNTNSRMEDNTHEDIMRDDDREKNYLADYGMGWLLAWRETNSFVLWNQYTDHEIYEIVEPGHPGMGNISIVDIQNTLSNRLRDLQLRQNFQPLRNTLSRAVSGGAKAVSTGRTRLFRGMDALWNEFERGMNEEAPRRSSVDTVNSNASGQTRQKVDHNRRWSSIVETASKSAKTTATTKSSPSNSNNNDVTSVERPNTPTSPLESSTQQAGRLFSSFSSFLSRKQREISQVMEDSMTTGVTTGNSENSNYNNSNNPRSPVSRTASSGATSDDDSSSAFVDVGAMYSFSPSSTNSNSNNNNNTVSNQTKKGDQSQDNDTDNLEKKKRNDNGDILDI